MSNPVFKAPEFDEVGNYPAKCRERFLAACGARRTAPYHADKRRHEADAWAAVDDFLTWHAIYGDGVPL